LEAVRHNTFYSVLLVETALGYFWSPREQMHETVMVFPVTKNSAAANANEVGSTSMHKQRIAAGIRNPASCENGQAPFFRGCSGK